MSLLGRLFTGWDHSPLVTPLLVLTIAAVLASQFVPTATVSRLQALFARQRSAVQVGLLGAALLTITTLGPSGVAPFIYYRF
jgi:alginate O-acetyltransferase complex protein AlgI